MRLKPDYGECAHFKLCIFKETKMNGAERGAVGKMRRSGEQVFLSTAVLH